MGQVKDVRDLESEENLTFQERQWAVQRVAWAVVLALLVAGLLGLLGPGPLSRVSAGETSAGPVLEFDRFLRRDSPTTLLVRSDRILLGEGGSSEHRLTLPKEYLQAFEVRQVTPEPERVEPTPEGVRYVFRATQDAAVLEARFHLEPRRLGRVGGRVGLGEERLDLWQWVYP
ncbi:hypothetical protein Mterra_03422 [Calidithermus terrae]|uniref:Uncharacterized protein n=1 Tax=Calidithermus terrae TaxID=1408545 RepID=A0A399EBS9_9DEIN|nr:hypothetical protein [Calidithermus terrae]RIH80953.1 hypothetical protein Mterra_03422 [Calidithermus terrae]